MIYPKETKSLFIAVFYDDFPVIVPIIAENIIQAEELMKQRYKESINYIEQYEIKGPYNIPVLGHLFIMDTLNLEIFSSEQEYLKFINDEECIDCNNAPYGINITDEIQGMNEEIIL